MKLKEKVSITHTFVNSEAHKVADFKEKYPNITHNQIYLKGIEAICKEEEV